MVPFRVLHARTVVRRIMTRYTIRDRRTVSRFCVVLVSTRIEIFCVPFPPDEVAGDSTDIGMETSMASSTRSVRCLRTLRVARNELA